MDQLERRNFLNTKLFLNSRRVNPYFQVLPQRKTLKTTDFTKDLHWSSKEERIPDTGEERTSPNSFYEADIASEAKLKEEKHERSVGRSHS